MLSIQQEEVVVVDQNDPSGILTITNNVDESLALEVDVEFGESGLVEADGFATELSPGSQTTYAVTCEPGTGAGETTVDVTVHSATGDRISIEQVTESYEIERDCPGQGPPPEPGNGLFEISHEHWLDDREFIFEIVGDGVSSADWEFGDGTTGSGHYIRHTYEEAGTYDITLTATVNGETQTVTETLLVSDEPEEGDDKPPAEDVYDIRQEAWLDDGEYIFEIVGNVWSVDWEFGDGTTGSGHYVRHTYEEAGTYDITVVATIDGQQYTYTDTVVVNG
ncbi:PKD domain-containing protein [Natronorubrum texcoconense]|uniref:PKD domain-containing protein n=1 Tax=Natronorubrum texcoconense TaxID=1095776 RepID=A0A1G9GVG3_9EURY|nr:PKD domain-containing protein [Natronorubrum texcoconense]SDL04545.1 PKD domain-containing protein [Natronorubrum texcoconense]